MYLDSLILKDSLIKQESLWLFIQRNIVSPNFRFLFSSFCGAPSRKNKLQKLLVGLFFQFLKLDILIIYTFRSSHWIHSMSKGILKYFSKLTGKHLCQRLFLNKVAGSTLSKRRLQYRCFPVYFDKKVLLQHTSG